MTDRQNFLGPLILGTVSRVVAKKVEDVLTRPDVPVENDKAPEVARKVAPAIVEAVKSDPVIKAAINGEPLYQSKAFWLGVGGLLSSLGGMVTLYFNGEPDGIDAYMTLATAGLTAAGAIFRRWQFSPGR